MEATPPVEDQAPQPTAGAPATTVPAPATAPEPAGTEQQQQQPRRKSSLAERLEEKVEKLWHRTPTPETSVAAKTETEAHHHHKFWPHLGKEGKKGEEVTTPEPLVAPAEGQAQSQ